MCQFDAAVDAPGEIVPRSEFASVVRRAQWQAVENWRAHGDTGERAVPGAGEGDGDASRQAIG